MIHLTDEQKPLVEQTARGDWLSGSHGYLPSLLGEDNRVLTLKRRCEGPPLHDLWGELRQTMSSRSRSFGTEVELRLTGLITSPTSDVAQAKLGQYLQEGQRLREQGQLTEALISILVGSEYYWRRHVPMRAAGLLLEASDLLYLLKEHDSSYQCLLGALRLAVEGRPTLWWEFEILADTFLLTVGLSIVQNPALVSPRMRDCRELLPKKLQHRVGREDGYRTAIALRRAVRHRSLSPVDALDTTPTLRTRSEFASLYEYLMASAERYSVVRDGLIALRHLTQRED